MFDYLEMHLDTAKFHVKTNKKAIRCFFGLTVFNLSFLVFDYYNGIHGSMISQVALGTMIMNSIWSFCCLIEYLAEQKHDKKMLQFYQERKGEKNIIEALEEYRRAKDFYETAYKNGLENHIRAESKPSEEVNRRLQPSIVSDFPTKY